MKKEHPRIRREKKTAQAMVRMYCRAHHQPENSALCADCAQLLDYILKRIDACPFHEEKSPCPKCRVKCFAPGWMEKTREVMRYAGPRMMKKHPILALLHVLDGHRPVPDPGKKR